MYMDTKTDEKIRLSHFPAFKLLVLLFVFLAPLSFVQLNVYYVLPPLAVFLYFAIKKQANFAYIFATLTCAIVLMLRVQANSLEYPDLYLQDVPGQFSGKVEKVLSENDDRVRLKARGTLNFQELPKDKDCSILLNVYKRGKVNIELKAGDVIRAKVFVRVPNSHPLPNEMNEVLYAKYMEVQWFASAMSYSVNVHRREENVMTYFQGISQNLSQLIETVFSEESAGILQAMLLGDKSNIDLSVRDDFSLSGTAHLLALSGLHVGVISLVILLVVGFIPNEKVKFIVFSSALLFYAMLTGLSASVMRASLMAILLYFVHISNRRTNPLNTLSSALLLIILLFPSEIYSPSFQMSAVAVLGIILFYKRIRNMLLSIIAYRKSALIMAVVNSLSVTISASVIISPLIAYYFGMYSIISPVANLLIIPLLTFAMMFAVISLAIAPVSLGFALFYAKSVDFLISLAICINRYLSELPVAYVKDEHIIVLSLLVAFALLYVSSSVHKRKMAFRFFVSLCFVSGVMIMLSFSRGETEVRLFPRKNVVLAEIPISSSKTMYYIADRDNIHIGKMDRKLIDYISKQKGEKCIAITGFSGVILANTIINNDSISANPNIKEMRKLANTKVIELSHIEQDSLERAIALREPLPRVISTIY